MCNNKDFFERQQVEMLLSAELAKPYQEMDPDLSKNARIFYCRWMDITLPILPFRKKKSPIG